MDKAAAMRGGAAAGGRNRTKKSLPLVGGALLKHIETLFDITIMQNDRHEITNFIMIILINH